MVWADVELESDSDSECGSQGWLSGAATPKSCSPSLSETILNKVNIEKSLRKFYAAEDTTEDGSSEGFRSGTSTPARSGTCTPSSTKSSKVFLRNMPLTREQLMKMQQRNQSGEDTLSSRSPSSFDDSASFVSSTVPSTTGSSGYAMQTEPQNNGNTRAVFHEDYPVNAQKAVEMSVGSLTHEQGSCKPCMFQLSKTGCLNGPDCNFCHLQHSRTKFPRPSKGKRDRIKRLMSYAGAGGNSPLALALQE